MKEKEKKLIEDLLKLTGGEAYKSGCGTNLVGSDKQLHYYLEKWSENGWWDFGVSVRTGWFTPEGVTHFLTIIGRDIVNSLPNEKTKKQFKEEYSI